jgi:hypothetical protein
LTLSASAGLAEASDAPQSAIEKLAPTGEVSCQPVFTVFCSNIHVSCGGASCIKTFPFKFRVTDTHGSIDSTSDAAGMRQQYDNGRAEWDSEKAYVILRPHLTNGHIKILADGTYSFRHYSQHAAVMSHGHCN